jgi:hypothetical protein
VPSNKQQALGLCGCCGCVGCCYPRSGINLQPINWSISAPNCAEIDGSSGQLDPAEIAYPNPSRCGACQCYQAASIPLVLSGAFWFPFGDMCVEQSCGADLCFAVSCDIGEAQVEGPELIPCCSRLRLLMWGRNMKISRVDGQSGIPLDNSCVVGVGGSCQYSALTGASLEPESCTCEPELSAVWDLSKFQSTCLNGDVWVGGPCDGRDRCCRMQCDLTGAELVI